MELVPAFDTQLQCARMISWWKIMQALENLKARLNRQGGAWSDLSIPSGYELWCWIAFKAKANLELK
jgi:hypothetical protein